MFNWCKWGTNCDNQSKIMTYKKDFFKNQCVTLTVSPSKI